MSPERVGRAAAAHTASAVVYVPAFTAVWHVAPVSAISAGRHLVIWDEQQQRYVRWPAAIATWLLERADVGAGQMSEST